MIEIGNVVLIINNNFFERGKLGTVVERCDPLRGKDDWMVELEGNYG